MMNFLRPTWSVAWLPVLLVIGALMPFLLLRFTLYTYLAWPLLPVIRKLGWVYHDKPWFLTPEAALLTGVTWAVLFYVLLCLVRRYKI
ncbi:MAG: hypothetical protein P4L99_11930 [Chthoniobacter sp.]|nr:hypothetical protein [Chthoniobacter sp.]